MDSLVINQLKFSYSSRYSCMQISIYSSLGEIKKAIESDIKRLQAVEKYTDPHFQRKMFQECNLN